MGAGSMLLLAIGVGCAGCSALNPAFVDLLDAGGAGTFSTMDNAPGHVVIMFVNNAIIDERLLNTLDAELELTDAEKRSARPRIRARFRVAFVDDTFQTIEFVSGSRGLVDPDYTALVVPDLNQNDLDNVVVSCDVASVELEPGTSVEVFVPVEVTAYELVEVAGTGDNTVTTTFEARETRTPQFETLEVDDVDADGNVILRRNIGVRDAPGPTPSPRCGSVVAITLDGVLSVPYLSGVSEAPSFDRDDAVTAAGIGGRYEFIVSVQ